MKRTIVLMLVVLLLLPSLTLAQDDDRITIRFIHRWGNVTWIPEVLEPAFEAAFPQYDLELRVADNYNNAYDLYTLAHEQGDPPELLQGTSSNTQAPRDTGFFKPLHEAIGDRTESMAYRCGSTRLSVPLRPSISWMASTTNCRGMPRRRSSLPTWICSWKPAWPKMSTISLPSPQPGRKSMKPAPSSLTG